MELKNSKTLLSDEICMLTYKIKEASKSGIQCIGFTSPMVKQGKTHLICQLAEGFSLSHKILVIDANPFNPKLSKYFKLQKKIGLHELTNFNSSLTFDTLASYIYTPANFSILPLGYKYTVNDLYKLDALKLIFTTCRQNFDYILVALPTLEHFNAFQPMTGLLDTSILIVKEGDIDIKALPLIKENLSAFYCPILSCIFNGTAPKKNINT